MSVLAFAEIETVDFTRFSLKNGSFPDGWGEDGMGQYASDELVGAVYFSGAGDVIVSREFSAPILSVSIESATRRTNMTRRVTLTPLVGGVGSSGIELEPPTNKTYVSQKVDIAALGATKFKLVSSSGSGNWAVRKIVVVYGREESTDPVQTGWWTLSSFLPKPGFRVADFSGIGGLKTHRSWSNGVDGDSFYAYKNADAATIIRPATESSVYADLYCYNAGTETVLTNGLALLGSDSTGLRLILPIRLDTVRRPTSLDVSYDARVVKSGTAQTRLSFSWATVNDITAMDGDGVLWTNVEDAAFLSSETRASQHVGITVRSLREAAYLCLKWSVPRQANSAMIGLSDLRVEGQLRDGGFILVVR